MLNSNPRQLAKAQRAIDESRKIAESKLHKSDFNEKLKIQMLRDEAVLRHLCTKLDKYAVEYNARKKSGVKSHTEKAVEA